MAGRAPDRHHPLELMKSHNASSGDKNAAYISAALDDAGLSPAQFRVYCHINRRAGTEGEHWESLKNCAVHCQLHPDTVKAAIEVLLARGMIQIAKWPLGGSKHYRVTTLGEWSPPPKRIPTIETSGASEPPPSPMDSMPGGGASKPGETPRKGMPPKSIPSSHSTKVNPDKEDTALRLRSVDFWKLTKDRESLRMQIRESKESTKPDPDLIRGFRVELLKIEAEIKRRGVANPVSTEPMNNENLTRSGIQGWDRNAGTYNANPTGPSRSSLVR